MLLNIQILFLASTAVFGSFLPRREGRTLLEGKCSGCNVAVEGQFPYIVALTYGGYPFCTGTIISPYDILTAAHCVNQDYVSQLTVLAGAADATDGREDGEWEQIRRVESVVEHGTGDIAVLRLEYPFNIIHGHVSWLPLNSEEVTADTLTNPISLGFGQDTADPFHSRLHYTTQVGFVSDEVCSQRIVHHGGPDDDLDGATELCVKYPKGLDVCYGDSGSPLITSSSKYGTNPKVVGVLSRGAVLLCGEGEPDVFTEVAAHVGWITDSSYGDVEFVGEDYAYEEADEEEAEAEP